ncbi:boi-related E3 ubiquitin-protein ligase 1 [Phtheirospermum japonicum]|uniref:Boi-related E3 ubiquitin-protein ligase 1 n=1 Tax=Phtheirospermum japonicum TaxID=374723 RepID=A0A830BPF0_9LAMI|nr:boi-related E3 ubiquitin-protein ligase 1 [Phtheirospermum japonicum]
MQTDILRQALDGMLERQHKTIHRVAEESANKKLKQKENELLMKSAHIKDLEVKAEHYKREADRLSRRVSYLETKTRSLKARLENANMARRYGEPAHEEGDSSTEDPTDRDAGPVKLDCKVCDRQLATMLVWPCRHVCVCKQCEADTKYCPVCRVMKLTSVEVFLSLKQD